MGGGKKQRIRDKVSESAGDNVKISSEGVVNARVDEVIGRTGARGEVTQVKVTILAGKNQEKSMRRNIKGLVKIGDLVTLRETEIEARRIKGGRIRSL